MAACARHTRGNYTLKEATHAMFTANVGEPSEGEGRKEKEKEKEKYNTRMRRIKTRCTVKDRGATITYYGGSCDSSYSQCSVKAT